MGIVTVLQSKKYVKADVLANIFEISVRTVYRDINALEEIGIPVGFENKLGYFIAPGYFLSPVSFTNEEANSFVLIEALVNRFSDKSVIDNFQSALNKIKAVMKSSEKESMETLNSHISIHIPSSPANKSNFLAIIQNSIIKKIILKMEYVNNQSEKSIREIEPIGLVFYAMNWHIIAWCWHRSEYRDFKLPGILRLKETTETFRRKKHISLNEYIDFIIQKYSQKQ
jgi:predicted DNA-binding transcriptional regulator YafY